MTSTDEHSFDEASASFLAWFTSFPGTTFHPSLQINDLRHRDAGRGIVAKSDIPTDTDLFTIPRTAIIGVESSELAQKLPDIFHNHDEDGRDDSHNDSSPSDLPKTWLDLILILLYESLRGPSSPWYPYLSILPSTSKSFNSLIFWNEQDLLNLQASAISSKIGRDKADAIFISQILPVVKAHTSDFYGSSTDSSLHLSDKELLLRCHVIGSLIMSYAFDLQPDEDEEEESSENEDGWIEDRSKPSTMGMVPMADMLNADAEFNAHLSHGDDALTMTSLRTIKAGEEVLNYYGPLPNAELARRYGYTSSKHSRYDVVEVSWSLVRKSIVEELSQTTSSKANPNSSTPIEKITKLLDDIEKGEDRTEITEGFLLEREAGDPNEEGLCLTEPKFTKFPEELTDVVSEIVGGTVPSKASKQLTQEQKMKELKRRTLQIFRRVVQGRIAEYATTLQQDENILAKGSNGTAVKISNRMKMALDIRMGEKRLLNEALGWTENMLAKYAPATEAVSSSRNGKGGAVRSGQPPSKKQKR